MVHLSVHLVEEAKLGGPVHSRDMYPVERELGNFKPFVRIKSQLEGSIAKGHIAEETLTCFSQYMDDTETRFNRPRRVRDDPNYIQPSGMSTIFPQLSSSDENLRQAELPYYGKLEDIIEINMDDSRLFFSNVNGLILLEIEEHEPYIEASQAQLVSYVDDILNKGWSVVVHLKPRDMYDMGESSRVNCGVNLSSQINHERPGRKGTSTLCRADGFDRLAVDTLQILL
ncbi:hypothetical protein KY285_000702 [Solanum tuberosum]|nr:hypothetical protein KY285_000702 [Solanum tuberosum]